MQRWTDLSQVPRGYGPSVVTLGNFDGVHGGHRAILTRTVTVARDIGATAVALTFDPHPATVHRPDRVPVLLTGIDQRLDLLEATGLDAVLVARYTLDFARQSPEDFVRAYLVDGLGARAVVVGRDVRFGWGNAGDLSTMVDLGRSHGFEVHVVDDAVATVGGQARRRSSTWVRELLAEGRVDLAAQVLGRGYQVRGQVVRGDARGRAMGFPTANLGPALVGVVPADGVYAGWLVRPAVTGPDHRLPAAVSIGTNPTFDGVERRVEAYVLDRTDLDLYGEQVAVEFVALLRPTLRFDSVPALVAQMQADVEAARPLLS